VFRIPITARSPLRLAAIALSAALFVYLVSRAGPATLWQNLVALGWGFMLVIALAGVSHLARTWAWRITIGDDGYNISFPRLLGLRLGAEAAGQFGFVGQTFGDSVRVAQLSPEIPIARSVASVTLDRGFYAVTGTVTTITGILVALLLVPLSHTLRLYASGFVLALIAFLLLALLALRKRWPVLSGSARIIGRVPSLTNWIQKRYSLLQSVENALFDFHHQTPKAFWASFSLNMASQCMAILEVCLILWLMSTTIGFLRALLIEALTKLVNVIGNFNPGNIATYEGGTMLIGKMFGLSAATGLALGVARRLRSIFWAAVGAICLLALTRSKKRSDSDNAKRTVEAVVKDTGAKAECLRSVRSDGEVTVAILLADGGTSASQIRSSVVRIASLPLLLRTILAAQRAGAARVVVVVDSAARRSVQRNLFWTGRLPEFVQWVEVDANASLSQQLRLIASQGNSERLVLIDGNATYHPSLLREAIAWRSERTALALTSSEEPIGIYALSAAMIENPSEHCTSEFASLVQLHASPANMHSVVSMPVPENLWQHASTTEECLSAERKLNRWLLKPTDGIYARLNRKISIPISRQLIKFPITANMVTIFTLGVGFAAGTFFALGGYWNTLIGACLCLFASILDGCDGEVARLKMLESDFGCWLETICDYAFYLILFVGMTIGLWRTSDSTAYLTSGGLLLFGAIASFLATGWERHRLASARPEQLLKIWQAHAESRPSNPFLYLGRQMEFIVRRCFFPYALLFFALFNIMNVAFILSMIGANLVWPIALYSCHTFGGARTSKVAQTSTVISTAASV